MRLPFFKSKRRAPKEGKQATQPTPQQPREQARLGWTPTPKGQLETERLLSGDVSAAEDLKTLLTRAGNVSRQAPQLNLNVRATDRWLQEGGSPGAIEELAEEQQHAQMRLGKGTSKQVPVFNLMRDSALVGEPFNQSIREWCDDSMCLSAGVEDDECRGQCRGHWRLRYCSGGGGRGAVAHGDAEGQMAERPVLDDGKEEKTEKEEDCESEFHFDDYFTDEENYRESLCEVTELAARPAPPKIIFIPARTSALRRKRGQASLRKPDIAGPGGVALSQHWSTQALNGSTESIADGEEEAAPDEDGGVAGGVEVRRSVRLSIIADPTSPPAVALPPSPPVPYHHRSSWPLPNTVDDTPCEDF